MASSNNDKIISVAHPHTIKKFELIESYIRGWAQKLMNNPSCSGLVYVDCMSNSGMYTDDNGKPVNGSPIRVANVLRDIAGQYPNKSVKLFFNDINKDKINLLESKLPSATRNYSVKTFVGDGNQLLKEMQFNLVRQSHLHYFILYDPYDASIDWEALAPYFRHWGEVMINHMVSDPIRAISQVRKEDKIRKYENTYLADIEEIIPFGTDRKAYEERIEYIIQKLKGDRRYFVAAAPFFNSNNALQYNMIHCTSNIEGFKLFKTTAWKTFGDKSSTKTSRVDENQITLDMFNLNAFEPVSDEGCLRVKDIVQYVFKTFNSYGTVFLDDIWALLDKHPVFPSKGYCSEVKTELKALYGVKERKAYNIRTGKQANVLVFPKGLSTVR